jgi:hypothetical protein
MINDLINDAVMLAQKQLNNPRLVKLYGGNVCEDIPIVAKSIENTICEVSKTYKDFDCIVVDSAGIGDCVHSRLLVQHLKAVYDKILWLVPPISESLYADDDLVTVAKGYYCNYRCQEWLFMKPLYSAFNQMLLDAFTPQSLYHIPYNIAMAYGDNKPWPGFLNAWFAANKIERDITIKHELKHHGISDICNDKYVIIEHSSMSNGCLGSEFYYPIVKKLESCGIRAVCVGGKSDSIIDGCIDYRGRSLYDVMSLIKRCCGFIGMSSGNECLLSFYPTVKLIEINVPYSLANEGYPSELVLKANNVHDVINAIDFLI